MEYYNIDFYKGFKCLGSKCPNTCCRGWQIPVDDETYARYTLIPGFRGFLFRLGVTKKSPHLIRKAPISCPFLTRERLCLHEKQGNPLLMPLVCRNYPRRITDLGSLTELTMELSCPEAAGLFIDNPGRREFVKSSEKFITHYYLENDDEDFLGYLKDEREKMLDYIWQEGSLYLKWETLFAYVYARHDLIAGDDIKGAREIVLTEDKEAQGIHAVFKSRGFSFYRIKAIDRMILDCIDRGNMIFKAPLLFKLLKKYYKLFSKLTLEEADRYFSEGVEEMCRQNPALSLKYRSYFSYTLQQEFLESYESYATLRQLSLCILYTQLLMLFDLLEFKRKKALPREVQIKILYLTEHNLRHNPSLTKALYNIIREELL